MFEGQETDWQVQIGGLAMGIIGEKVGKVGGSQLMKDFSAKGLNFHNILHICIFTLKQNTHTHTVQFHYLTCPYNKPMRQIVISHFTDDKNLGLK